MNKQLLSIGLAVIAVALAGGVLIHSLRTRRAGLAEQDLPTRPVPDQPPVPFHEAPDPAPMARRPPPPADPLAENLFPPELIMQFQDRIGLSNEQRQAIMTRLQEAQPKFEKRRTWSAKPRPLKSPRT